MKKINISTDRIIGLSAMLISLLTLIIFIYQTNIIRTQSRLSVRPRIAINQSQNTQDSTINLSVEIINKGLGPAIIESIQIIHEQRKYDLDFPAFFKKVYPDIYDFGNLINNTSLSKGSTLSPGESITLFTFSTKLSDLQDLIILLGAAEKYPFEIDIIYASIYDEQWRVNSEHHDHPIEL